MKKEESETKAFCSLSLTELKKFLIKQREPSYRASQLASWVYQKGISDYYKMTNIGREAAQKLEKIFYLPILSKVKTEESLDRETTKFLFALKDKKYVESVIIRSFLRRTLCISSQVGCPARCAFCASGQLGLLRNLSSAEIVEQVVHIQQVLCEIGEKISHLVFMGMGEPLENIDAVIRAIKILVDPKLGGFSSRRITLSTVGVIPGIYRLLEEGITVNLALSLHAPNQHIREKIVPYARKFPLEELLRAVRSYAKKTKRNMTYEYVLLAGINDRKEDAKALASLLKKEPCCVNLIPYNPVDARRLKRPQKEVIEEFRKILSKAGVRSTWRYTKGKDIAAACGQLAVKEKKSLEIA